MMNLIRKAAAGLTKRFPPRGIILMYHRIAKADLDPWGLCVSPRHFAEHLEAIKRHFHPLSLHDLCEQCRDGTLPDRSIVLTFDDGYADNLHTAKPLLEQYRVPATIFLVADILRDTRHFWWDELEWALLQPGTLPAGLELNTNIKSQTWQLGDAIRYNMQERRGDRNRKPWEASPGTRLAFFYSVWKHLVLLPKRERVEALDTIRRWAGIDSGSRDETRALHPDEAAVLCQGGLISLGAHTVTHPSLPLLSSASQLDEIQESKTQLENFLNRPMTSFAYPHGDYSAETAALVQKSGFQCACTTQSECVSSGADPFQLPRFQVEDWDGAEFLNRLLRKTM